MKEKAISEQLKRPLIYYLGAGVLFFFIILSAIISDRYNDSLQETVDRLKRVKENLLKMDSALSNLDILLSRITQLLPSDFYTASRETKIFIALDGLKSRLGDGAITVSQLEDKGDMLSLPVNMKGTLKSYTALVNDIGYLMSLKFPFFTIDTLSLSINEVEGRSGVVYVIDGRLKMPKK